MKEIKVFSNDLNTDFKNELTNIIHNFDTFEGGVGKRNIIKIIPIEGLNLNIKAFKIPNAVNKIVYHFCLLYTSRCV